MRVLVMSRDPDLFWYPDYEGTVIAKAGGYYKIKRRFKSKWVPVNGPFCKVIAIDTSR